MRKQTADYKIIKGWVTDVNINNNVGNPTFQNLSLTPIGKLTKRKGWTWVLGYNEVGKNNSNLKIDFDRLTTGTGGYPLINIFHCKPFTTTVSGVEVTYRDILIHKIVTNVNEIWRYRYDSSNTLIESKKISVDGQFQGACNVRFVETPDHVYIINDYHKGTVSGTVYKYKYGKTVKSGDNDKIYNVTNGAEIDIEIQTLLSDAQGSTQAGKYKYMVLPVYNTGAVGSFDTETASTYIKEISAAANTAVIIKIYANYNPHVIGYNVYRTKVNPVIKKVEVKQKSGDFFINPQDAFNFLKDMIRKEEPNADAFNAKVDVNEFYFLNYYPKPNNPASPAVKISLVSSKNVISQAGLVYQCTDANMNDNQLGEVYEFLKPINYYKHDTTLNNGGQPLSTEVNSGYGMLCTCGTYAQNRLILGGDGRYPSKLFISELDKTDYFGVIIYDLELANLENRQTTIQETGNNIFSFLKTGIYVLRPNSDPEIPYTKELLTPTVGCDSLNSACVLEGICYFMFNNKLWALNAFGQFKEISTAINTQFTSKASDSEIILKPNAKDRSIKIMFRNTSDEPVNIDYYPNQDLFNEQKGDKDIYAINGATAVLNAQSDRYKLVNFEYMPDIDEEWGVDFDGNLVKRTSTYQDTSIGSDVTSWLNWTADNTGAVKTYAVNGVMEKPFVFNSRVRFNSVILFGSGDIDMAYKVDNGAYGAYRTYTMTRTGTECPLNGVGSIHSIKLRHTANSDIDFDFMKVKWTSQTNVDISNNVDAGA